MSVKLRLVRFGRKKRPFYRIAAVDSRKKRDGAYIERVGYYNPLSQPAEIVIDEEKAMKWLDRGAQPSDTVRNLLSKKGILLKRSLIKRQAPAEQVETEIQKWGLVQEAKQTKKKKAKKTPTEVKEQTPPEATAAVETKPEAPETPAAPAVPEVPEVLKSDEAAPVEPEPEKEEPLASEGTGEPEEKS